MCLDGPIFLHVVKKCDILICANIWMLFDVCIWYSIVHFPFSSLDFNLEVIEVNLLAQLYLLHDILYILTDSKTILEMKRESSSLKRKKNC